MSEKTQEQSLATAALLIVHEMVVGLNELLVDDMPHRTRAVMAQAFTDIEHIIHQVVPKDVITSDPMAYATALAALDVAATNIVVAAAVSDMVANEED